MRWHFERQHGKPHKRVVRVNLEAPLFDEDEEPNEFSGICPGPRPAHKNPLQLWNYECVELFFANQKGHYVEVEVGPHGHWLVLLHKGYRDCFNKGEELELEVRNEFQGSTWRCTFEIPLAYFPGGIRRFNAYALHTVDGVRHYEALHTVTDGGLSEPDFHKLEYFGPIDFRRVVPEGYNRHPFNDIKYGDLWESVNPKKTEEE
ncbi:Protein C33A12.3 a [Aphelenchoides avenae]|nr:Protein C33A12.3 a [Aphelenchus avenae]